jgi:hypothetical protein
MGPAFAGFSITLIMYIGPKLFFVCSIFVLLALSQIDKKPIMNPKSEVMQSLTEGIKFVFNNKTVLGAITLIIAVLLVEL